MIKKECKQCGKQFTISDSEIYFYRSKNLTLPKRCKKCRKSNKKISTSDDRKKYMRITIACCTAVVVVICVTAAFLLSEIHDITYEDNQAIYKQTQAENVEITSDYVQTDNGYTQNNDSDDEMSVAFTSDPQQQIGFTEVPGGNNYDDHDAVVFEFRNEDLLESHFQKHGKDMGFESAEEYELAASAVINSSAALHKTEKEDGDDVYYIESTNDFVIVSTDGYIRTYFRPDSGKNYYDNQ